MSARAFTPNAPPPAPDASPAGIRLGLRANLAQFTLLVAVNARIAEFRNVSEGKRALTVISLGTNHVHVF